MLQRKIDSLNDWINKLEAKIQFLEEIAHTNEAKERQWFTEKLKQQLIIQQQLKNSDDTTKALQDEIRDVKKKFKLAIENATLPNGQVDKKDLLARIRELY